MYVCSENILYLLKLFVKVPTIIGLNESFLYYSLNKFRSQFKIKINNKFT